MTIDYRAQAIEFAKHLLGDASKGPRRRKGDCVIGRCPTEHEDKHPSFSYDIVKDAYSCSCGSGKGSELRSRLNWSNGANGHENVAVRPNVKALAPMPFSPPPARPPDCIHPYQNGNRKLRWYESDGSKKIVWQHEVKGEWIVGKDGETGLYNEPAIAQAETIYLSESETDIDAITTLGLTGSCHGYGAAANLKPDQCARFKRKRVPILEHNDEPGRMWAEKQLILLTLAGADAWIVHIPEPHKDIRDCIKSGADRQAVEFMAAAYEPKDLLAERAKEIFDRTPDTIEYILEPIISTGCLLQIQGNPKSGKSCIALLVALSCSLGRWVSGRFNYCGGPRRTLYISYEDSPRRLKRRAKSYLAAMGADNEIPEHLFMFQRPPTMSLGTDAGRAVLDAIIRKNKIEVLIIDTLSWVSEGNENDKADMQPVMATLRYIMDEYKTAIVLIHHTRKGGQTGDQASVSERGRGSSAIAAAADSILDFGSRVSPNHTMCKFISKDADEDEFICVYQSNEDGSVSWKLEEVVEREDSIDVKRRIMESVAKLSETSSEVTAKLVHETMKDLSERTVRNYLKNLFDNAKLDIVKGKNRAIFYSIKSAK